MELEFPLLEGKMPRDDDDCPTEDNSSTDEDGFSKVPSEEDELNSASQSIPAGLVRSTSEQEVRRKANTPTTKIRKKRCRIAFIALFPFGQEPQDGSHNESANGNSFSR
jgi:hypothetical protein